jgi:hypothetical protein
MNCRSKEKWSLEASPAGFVPSLKNVNKTSSNNNEVDRTLRFILANKTSPPQMKK